MSLEFQKPAGSRAILLLWAMAAVWLWALPQAQALIDASLQMQLGNPSNATASTNDHNHYLIRRPVEALDYSDNLGEPNWASWDLTSGDIGSSGRSSSFYTDTNLPPNFTWVTDSDYSGSGYDRGHMCPSGDRTDTTTDNDMVFFMSNIIPQASDNNQGVWDAFENYCRSLATSGNELLITCGPGGFDGSRIPSGKAAIPQFTWKIAVVVPLGAGTATNRISTTTRVIAIKVPNTNGLSRTISWTNFVTSANQLQGDTGLTFFTALPSPLASALRSKIDGLVEPPPVIYGFSPSAAPSNTIVTITGTNFDSALAITFNGVSAAFTVNSRTQITATVPPNSVSGPLAVTTPSGTATSTDNFIVQGTSLVDLALWLQHSGNFTQGDTADTYTIVITNIGNADSSGTVSVVDTLPSGLTATSFAGNGWTTELSTLTATRSDSMPAGTAYPPLVLTVSVSPVAPGFLTNSATVSGGGDVNAANNSAVDPTAITGSGVAPVLLSQVYGGGGNNNASYLNDFVELFNPNSLAVDLSTWSVQYASVSSSNWSVVNLSGSIQAGHYYLVQLGSGGTNGAPLPVPDATESVNLSATGGKVALVSNQFPLTNSNPVGLDGVVDFVGYGAADSFEGSGPAPAPSANTSILRANGGETDTDNNAADFSLSAVNPRNSTSAPPSPDLAVSISHAGTFSQGDTGDTFMISITNLGTGASTGIVIITNSLPAGLSPTAISGSGWTADLATLTCTRSDALPVGASYPPVTITVNVSSVAPSVVTNTATVSTSGDTNTANNVATDVTTIASVSIGSVVTLAGWDVSGQSGYGVSPLSPTTNASNLTVGGLTRGSGIGLTGTAAGRAWGGNCFTNTSASTAIAANRFATFSLKANPGYKISLTSISRFDYRRSGTGPPNGLLQYQLGNNGFVDVSNLSYAASTSAGGSLGPVDLSLIPALQNVGDSNSITFRIVNWGATSTNGTWYVFDVLTNSSADLAVQGIVSPALTPIESWRLQWFGSTANSGAGADTVISTSDGMPNLLKYALGLNPLIPTNDPVAGDIATGFLRLTVPKNANATDVSFQVLVSTDLTIPAWTTNGTTVDVDSPTMLQVHYNVPVAESPGAFIRLEVSRP